MEKEREILYYEDYFIDFFMSLDDGAKKKVSYVLDMLKTQERLNKNFVKLIRDGVYELRASHNGNIYRAFFIFDDGNIVMLFNGFQKKPPHGGILCHATEITTLVYCVRA